MSKIKLILLSIFAVLAVSAVASSSASAFSFLIEGKALTANETTTSSGGPAVLETAGTKIECAETEGEDTLLLLQPGLTDYHILFKTCAVSKPLGCTVAQPILVKGLDHLVLLASGALATLFLPATGNTFVTLTFANKTGETCSITGTQEVTGIAGALVVGGEESKETGELEFTNATSGSKLELAGVSAKFKLKALVKLSGANKGKKWSAMMN